MKAIAYFDSIGHQGHSMPGHPERPERLEVIKNSLQKTGYWDLGPKLKPLDLPRKIIKRVHNPDYLDQLKEYSQYDQDFDAETYLTKKSWELALKAAGGAAAVAGAVWGRKAASGFALTRPPGHHATPNQAMGFCLLNNIAITAEYLLQSTKAKKLAIVDIDVHHGNGTQDIFWERDDVLFISIHQSPLYPGTGLMQERGADQGLGFTMNIPLPPYSGDDAFAAAFDELILPRLEAYQPEMLLISFGYDAHWRDPLANLLLSANAYAELIGKLKNFAQQSCEGRIAVLLEGGYDLEAGAACGLAITQALLGETFVDELGPPPYPENENWKAVLEEIKAL